MKIHSIIEEGKYKDDASLIKVKNMYCDILEEKMRAEGKVPVLDMYPLWQTSWDSKKEQYTFRLTVYGVYVGKVKAKAGNTTGYEHESGKLILP